MPFNVEEFERADLVPRTSDIKVPNLAPWFDDDDEPVWRVRGLDGTELHAAMNADDKRKALEKIVNIIEEVSDQGGKIKKGLALDKTTPGEIAKRLEMLVAGSVEPEINLQTAIKIAQCFPGDFLILTNEITQLTGLGYDYAKPAAASLEAAS